MLTGIIIFGVGLLLGAVVLGLAEILSGSEILLSRDENKNKGGTIFLPREELEKYLEGKPRLSKLKNCLQNKNMKAAYMLLEDGKVASCEFITDDLKDEVNSRGYYHYRGDKELISR